MARIRTKLCGMMTADDARHAADAGADAVGMILHAEARRRIDLTIASQIVAALPPYVTPVGVFVDAPPTTVLSIAQKIGLTTVQLQGNESPADVAACAPLRVIKVVKVDDAIETTLDTWRAAGCVNLIALLLETAVIGHSGGTGVANDFDRIARLLQSGAFQGLPPIIIAGGLTPENVGDVVLRLNPYAVDVSSGIETQLGKKSSQKMVDFVRNATAASR